MRSRFLLYYIIIMIQISLNNDWKKQEYKKKYDLNSVFYLVFILTISIWVIGGLISLNFDNIPLWLISIRRRIFFIGLMILISFVFIIFINWSIYILWKIIWINYADSKIANYIEYIFWWIFPKKMYSRGISIRKHKKTTIFYWVILNFFIWTTIFFVWIYIKFPTIAQRVSEIEI